MNFIMSIVRRYNFMELTEKLKKMQDRLFNIEYHDPGKWYFADVNILDLKGNEFLRKEPMVVRKAYAHQYICHNLPTIIKPDEIIVGCPNQNSVGWGSTIPKYFDKEEEDHAAEYELNECSIWGHHPPAFDKIINLGVVNIKKEVEEALFGEMDKEEPDQLSIDEYRAMLIALDGVVDYARRYSDEALKLATACKDPERKAELLQIYEVCRKVPLNPATTLQEATQSYWLTYSVVNSGGEFIPLGRADQYLYPYYQRDIDSGLITEEDAVNIIGNFLIKCNERVIIDTKKAENHYNFGLFSQGVVLDNETSRNKINGTGGFSSRGLSWQYDEDDNSEANFNYGQSGNDWLMNCMVGGVHSDGTDATNRISYLFVELMNDMDLLMPTLGARVHDDTPESFLKLLAKVLRYGQGEPIIYNDNTIIPGFVDLGIPVEEARDYCSDGCWETLIPGKSHFSYAHIMNLQCLEWVLNRGVSIKSGAKEGLDTGDPLDFATFDDFYAAYVAQMNDKIDFQCRRRMDNLGLSYMIAPDPLFSSITYDCVKNGRDISQDGARYIFHMILATGLADTVDSLAVIKKLVYDEKKITMEELITALKDNWEGHERLHALVMNKVPKFGNDDDYVDEIAVRLLKDFEDHVQQWQGKHPKIKYPCGIGTFENYAVLGRDTAASANGRTNWEALAPNYSPVSGRDLNGPLSVLKSISKPDLKRYYAGTPVDIAVNSNEFDGDAGVERLKDLIASFCEMGGQVMTITSTNVEDLKDAKVHPEKHKDLRVRMGGLSAYFIAMSPVQQDNIIKRFSR